MNLWGKLNSSLRKKTSSTFKEITITWTSETTTSNYLVKNIKQKLIAVNAIRWTTVHNTYMKRKNECPNCKFCEYLQVMDSELRKLGLIIINLDDK